MHISFGVCVVCILCFSDFKAEYESGSAARLALHRDALAVLVTDFPGRDLLTERERVVLSLLVQGASSKEVARALGISPRTADFHRANIIEKLGARNTADVIRRVLGGS